MRTCDGYYFPISYSTTPASFPQDEQTCQRMCPAAEVALYTHRNPGEDIAQAVSTGGRSYSELPNAFTYPQGVQLILQLPRAGPELGRGAQAPRRQTVEQGDIVVTEEQRQAAVAAAPTSAKAAPKKARAARQGRTHRRGVDACAQRRSSRTGADGKRTVRTVGPTFIPAN